MTLLSAKAPDKPEVGARAPLAKGLVGRPVAPPGEKFSAPEAVLLKPPVQPKTAAAPPGPMPRVPEAAGVPEALPPPEAPRAEAPPVVAQAEGGAAEVEVAAAALWTPVWRRWSQFMEDEGDGGDEGEPKNFPASRRTGPSVFRLPQVTPAEPGAGAPMLIMAKAAPDKAATAKAAPAKAAPGRAGAPGPSESGRPADASQHLFRHLEVSQGQPIPRVVRQPMEAVFRHALSDVRLHTDEAAGRAAHTLGAQAFTVGRRIYFAAGRFPPTADGAALLGHELTHVMQAAQPQAAALTRPMLKADRSAAPRMVQLAPESHAERQAEETETQIRQLFEAAPAAPMVLKRSAPPARSDFPPSPAPEPHPGPVQRSSDSGLPTARVIQASTAASVSSAAAVSSAAQGGEQQPAGSAADVHQLAEQVYRLIKSRLRVERERMGLR
jgi:hypothetical protein